MTLSPNLEALKLEALRTSCEAWAIRCRWTLGPGIERAGPCPVCGGKDRFAINTAKNLFNCRRCGIAGEGVIKLVELTQNVSFTRACEIVTGRSADAPADPARTARLAAEAEAERQKRERQAEDFREQARRAAHIIWKESTRRPWRLGEPVFDYLAVRGIDLARLHAQASGALHMVIRQHSALDWREGRGRETVVLHTGPAMIAAIQLPDDRLAGVHQTWIDLSQPKGRLFLPDDDAGKPRATKKVRGTQKGAAIRLHTPPHPRRMVMGEGIESTLSVLCWAFEPDTAYWAGVNLGNMAGRALRDGSGRMVHDQPDMDDDGAFVPPEWCRELVYLTDGDNPESRIVEKLTRGLRRAIRMRPGLVAKRVPAPGPGQDMNDLAMAMMAAGEVD